MPIDLAAADAAYKRFPSYSEWAGVDLDLARWREHEAALEELRGADPEARRKALEFVRRAAAVQTGAIEGLYRADRGFTFTVAAQSALMEQALGRRTDKERALIEDQLAAYEHVLDFATQRVPIAEAWIRQLHQELCRRQKTYEVHTPQGRQEHALPLGRYKTMPNHVLQADGRVHSYAPVSETPREMARLVAELATTELAAAHPILQAAYAHYALVVVHPFADGNGRVARALGSVYTCRAYSLPLMIFEDARARYFAALATADAGRPGPFVEFVLERCIESVQIARDSFRVAREDSSDEVSEGIARLYRTRSGRSHREVDIAADNLRRALVARWADQKSRHAGREFAIDVVEDDRGVAAPPPAFRLPVDPPHRRVVVTLSCPAPANARVTLAYAAIVPQDCAEDGEAHLVDGRGDEIFATRVADLLPRPSSATELRLSMAVESLAAKALTELRRRAEEALKSRGY